MVRNAIKSKFIYNSWGNSLHQEGSWSFGNARNPIIFGVGNSLSSHAYDQNNNFPVLDKWPTDVFNDSIDLTEKKLVINLVRQKQNFA